MRLKIKMKYKYVRKSVYLLLTYIAYNNGHWEKLRYVPTYVWLLTARRGRQAVTLRS